MLTECSQVSFDFQPLPLRHLSRAEHHRRGHGRGHLLDVPDHTG